MFQNFFVFPVQGGPAHNTQECAAVRSLLEWCLRTTKYCDSKFVVASDSQVAIAILSTCRTSSLRIKRVCKRISALCLVSGMTPVYIWVQTARNPADKPSRRFAVKKRWQKKGSRQDKKGSKQKLSALPSVKPLEV